MVPVGQHCRLMPLFCKVCSPSHRRPLGRVIRFHLFILQGNGLRRVHSSRCSALCVHYANTFSLFACYLKLVVHYLSLFSISQRLYSAAEFGELCDREKDAVLSARPGGQTKIMSHQGNAEGAVPQFHHIASVCSWRRLQEPTCSRLRNECLLAEV